MTAEEEGDCGKQNVRMANQTERAVVLFDGDKIITEDRLDLSKRVKTPVDQCLASIWAGLPRGSPSLSTHDATWGPAAHSFGFQSFLKLQVSFGTAIIEPGEGSRSGRAVTCWVLLAACHRLR